MSSSASAAQEWRQYWFVPVAAALGYSTATLHSYGIGPFIEPLQQEFGWSRASISGGLTIAGLAGALFSIPVGLLVDRLGPRIVGLTGALLMPASIALLGTATGTLTNWYMLWFVIAFANLWLQTTVWTSAVASRFNSSRGLAFAVTLSGGSITSSILPLIATSLIAAFGWRHAFMAVAGIWVLAAFPFMFAFFRGATDGAGNQRHSALPGAVELPGTPLHEALRSGDFYRLFAASGLFTFTAVGIIVHFVPILTSKGATPLAAAGVAAIVGISSLIGRLSTGYMLDRLPGKLVGAVVFLLPIISCVLLIADGANPLSQSVAAALFGFTVGAEVDVIAYLVSRHFGLRHYGVLFGAIVASLATGSALGPLAAGATFDIFGSYSWFLALTIAMMALSSLALATLERLGPGHHVS